ncbi:MAG: cyclic nucleotide-binding domain-containing protein [Deltaproteobacteria bacterium]|nr:cyclic nucleotide-binding domain-containing protein [Deltaproteobacteria bacterium]
MNPLNAALDRIGVQPSERVIFSWAGLCLGLLGGAGIALANTAETLFLKRVGVEYLPMALLGSSLLLIGTTAGLGAFLARRDRPTWLPRILFLLALAVAPFGILAETGSSVAMTALLLIARQLLALGMLAFWVSLGDLLTGRQAKRLFGPLNAGMTVGAIAGSFASAPLAKSIGVEGMPLACALLLVFAGFASRRLRAARPTRSERSIEHSGGAATGRRAPSKTEGGSIRELWRDSRLFRLLFVSLLCSGLLGPILYFEFSYVADAATSGPDGEEQLIALYAQLRGWMNIVTLVIQLWLASRIYRFLGLPLSVAIWPFTYLVGFTWMGVQFGVRAGASALASGRIAEQGVAESALRILFNLFPEAVRARASGLLHGPVAKLGGATGNLAALAAISLGSARAVGFVAIPVAAIWLLAALALWRTYPSILLAASANQGLGPADEDREKLLDARTLRSMAGYLVDSDPATCRAAIDVIADADPGNTVQLLAEAVQRAPETTRSLLVSALHQCVEPLEPGRLSRPAAATALEHVLEDREAIPTEQRADLLQVYARLTGGDSATPASNALLDRTLGDREPAVRLAAIAELHRRGHAPPGAPDLNRALKGALDSRDVLMRRSARKELRAMLLSTKPDAQWHERLRLLNAGLESRADRVETALALLEIARHHGTAIGEDALPAIERIHDRDPRVRGPVLALAGHAGCAEQAPVLIAALASHHGDEAVRAREGLVALGADAVGPLLAEHSFGAASQREAIVETLRDLDFDPAELQSLYRRQIQFARMAAIHRSALAPSLDSEFGGLLRRRLEEHFHQSIGTALSLLAAEYDDPRISDCERQIRRNRDTRSRDIQMEILEAVLPGDKRAELVPLLENTDWAATGLAAARVLGCDVPAATAALAEMREDSDELTRCLARAISGEPEDGDSPPVEPEPPIGDAPRMLTPMEIAVRLQSVPAFDHLTTQQLMHLATVLREDRFVASDRIYTEGDEGSSLYFVLEGEVEAVKGELALGCFTPGEFFGELSCLDGIPRSETTTAQQLTKLLRLERDDLFSLMEDTPSLGISLSQFLSMRVRALQERLIESVSSGSPESS